MRWRFGAVMLLGLAGPALSLAQDVTLQQPQDGAPQQPQDAAAQQQEGTPDVGTVPGPDEPRRLDPVVVTATMVPTPLERLGATVTVVTGDEITQYNYDRIEDVFRQVPGVQVQTTGSPGKSTSLSIRGGGSQKSLVLIDGLRTASPTLGSTDIAEITIDAIDRIEIVRGPQSTLYGADAITGVVNIITKKGAGAPSASVWVEGGNYATFREQVNVQGAFGGFNFNVTGSQFNTDGNLPHDASAQSAVSGRVGYDFPWKGELSLIGRYSYLDLELPIFSTVPPPTVFDPNATNALETGLYNVKYAQPIFDWWNAHRQLRSGLQQLQLPRLSPAGRLHHRLQDQHLAPAGRRAQHLHHSEVEHAESRLGVPERVGDQQHDRLLSHRVQRHPQHPGLLRARTTCRSSTASSWAAACAGRTIASSGRPSPGAPPPPSSSRRRGASCASPGARDSGRPPSTISSSRTSPTPISSPSGARAGRSAPISDSGTIASASGPPTSTRSSATSSRSSPTPRTPFSS